MRRLLLASLSAALAFAQSPVAIHVNPAPGQPAFPPVWSYFGYDEPNFTYTANGQKLIRELAALGPAPVHIRTHFLLATGNGASSLKWGSTNAYTEDASGKPVYDWTIVDEILATYVTAGAIPFVEIGFMPEALSTHPAPYSETWRPGEKNAGYFAGWTYPPKDYEKWSELVYQWAKHCLARFGAAEVAKWDWEVWNEPNIGYWHGTPEEYDKLYDSAVAGLRRALPAARVGGPATTGPASDKAAAFLRQFLEHCASGVPLDFISFHAKGRPELAAGGRLRMGLSQELRDFARGVEIVRSFPRFQNLPIVVSEADPEGCAACSARVYPPNAYRNGTLYPSYEAAAMKAMLQIAAAQRANLAGLLTWAFEFEGQPYFDGLRTLATNGIDKPVLNVFRMLALMSGESLDVESDGALPARAILDSGVRAQPTVDALASRSANKIAILVWNYHDEDLAGPDAAVNLTIAGIPPTVTSVLLRHYRIDRDHSNSYTAWLNMGSPQNPSPAQYRALESAGQLQQLTAPQRLPRQHPALNLNISLPRQALSLLELSW